MRYLEDRKSIWFDFLKLRLRDVLLDPKTVQICTSNMNTLAKIRENSLTPDDIRAIMDYRRKTNRIKGTHGYFAGSFPQGGGGGKMGLTTLTESDIIKKGGECFIHDDKINKFFLLPGAKHSMDFFEVGYSVNDGERLKGNSIIKMLLILFA